MDDETKQIEDNVDTKTNNRLASSRTNGNSQPQADTDVTSRAVQQGAREHYRRQRLFQPSAMVSELMAVYPAKSRPQIILPRVIQR